MAVLASDLIDHSVLPGATGIVEPMVLDASPRARRQRTVNFAAKRYADMMLVSGLSRAEADRRLRLREVANPGGLTSPEAEATIATEPDRPALPGVLRIDVDQSSRLVTATWTDPAFGPPLIGHALAADNHGGIVLGEATAPQFTPSPVARPRFDADRDWPAGDRTQLHAQTALEAAADRMVATWPGLYGVLVATPESILLERYGPGGAPDRRFPSWSMTKAITGTMIGRLVHEGMLGSVFDPAPAPMWQDPRGIHRLITLDHLMRMRSGLGFPMQDGNGGSRAGFEYGAVYCHGEDAFLMAQRASVLTVPGATYRYVNTGINVLGAIIRDRIEARGLPYHAGIYALLADRIGMASYQHSADIAGNFIASGSGFATLRDYARFGLLLAQDGVWNGERLLPEGWVEYALRPSHAGTHYAACFRTNANDFLPSLPRDAAWASGASGQRVIVLRRHRLVIAVGNETDHAQDIPALDALCAAAIRAVGQGGLT